MNTDQAREQVSLAINHAANRAQLAARAKQHLTFVYNNGTFCVTTELLALLHMHADSAEIIIADQHNNPVKITNIAEFTHNCRSRYTEAMNEWHAEYTRINKLRPRSTDL